MDIRKKCQPHLWLLTGTVEGHLFAKSLLKEGWKITVSVVSDRAAIPYEKLKLEKVLIGALVTENQMRNVILNARKNHSGFNCVIDLTHPFATNITSSISKVCEELDQPFIRYERSSNNISNAFLIEKFSDLENFDLKKKSILLAVGVRHLEEAITCARNSGANVYARVLANPGSLKKAISSSIPKRNFAILNPSVFDDGKVEKALIRKWNIDGVICRQAGGRNEELWHQICSSMSINLWLLKRPSKVNFSNSIDSYEKLIKTLNSINIK